MPEQGRHRSPSVLQLSLRRAASLFDERGAYLARWIIHVPDLQIETRHMENDR